MAKQPKPQGKRRIAPTLVTAKAGSKTAMTTTQRSSGLASYKSALDRLEKKAAAMDKSAKGKTLISNRRVPRSRPINKTINKYA